MPEVDDLPARLTADIKEEDAWGAFLAGRVLAEAEQIGADAPQNADDHAVRERVRGWHRAIVQRGLLPADDRVHAGDTLAALSDDRPGVLHVDQMRLCYVPAGRFWLYDWTDGGKSGWYERLDRPYWIAQLPVTVAHFKAFVADSGYEPSDRDSLRDADNRPVRWVNWYDGLAFCRWLDARWRENGWLPPGYTVTLPSETEWEKAARGGEQLPSRPHVVTPDRLPEKVDSVSLRPNPHPQRTYPWGEVEDAAVRANIKDTGIGDTSVVGAFPAGRSPVGALEMIGQVWEWTRSLYDKPYPPQINAEFETTDRDNEARMILRGGSYYNDTSRCSARYGRYPLSAGSVFGSDDGVRVLVSPFLL